MAFIFPKKIKKSRIPFIIKTLVKTKDFALQKPTKKFPKQGITYRICTKGLPSNFVIARGKDYEALLKTEWVYVTQTLQRLIPPGCHTNRKIYRDWLFNHFAKIAAEQECHALTLSTETQLPPNVVTTKTNNPVSGSNSGRLGPKLSSLPPRPTGNIVNSPRKIDSRGFRKINSNVSLQSVPKTTMATIVASMIEMTTPFGLIGAIILLNFLIMVLRSACTSIFVGFVITINASAMCFWYGFPKVFSRSDGQLLIKSQWSDEKLSSESAPLPVIEPVVIRRSSSASGSARTLPAGKIHKPSHANGKSLNGQATTESSGYSTPIIDKANESELDEEYEDDIEEEPSEGDIDCDATFEDESPMIRPSKAIVMTPDDLSLDIDEVTQKLVSLSTIPTANSVEAGMKMPFGVYPLDSQTFNVRCGPDYPRNKKKEPSKSSLLNDLGMDVFRTQKKVPHIARFLKLPFHEIEEFDMASDQTNDNVDLELKINPNTPTPDGSVLPAPIVLSPVAVKNAASGPIISGGVATSTNNVNNDEIDQKSESGLISPTTDRGDSILFSDEDAEDDDDSSEDEKETEMEVPQSDYLGLPRMFIVSLMLPLYNASMIGGKTNGPGVMAVFYFSIPKHVLDDMVKTAPENHVNLLLKKFFFTNDAAFRERFKIIARVQNVEDMQLFGPFKKLVEKYNGKPLLSRPQHQFYRGPGYFEVDLDVHKFMFIARKGLASFRERIPRLITDIGFLVEARNEDEMPENVLGSMTLKHLPIFDCPVIPEDVVASWLEEEN
eukprot:TRINITY_DN774089_c0_g1_i1.p1 TRINITY_DN774089_c0_g1~~TRINITY_DN774089_c0_g1_i1.p1  ORF type:complete len:778 (+),score=235.42 TRINITY_DN774089_c0_g1_i1:73-2406(+)